MTPIKSVFLQPGSNNYLNPVKIITWHNLVNWNAAGRFQGVFSLLRNRPSQFCTQMGETSLANLKCQCKVLPLPFLLFAFHMEWQITCAKPLQGLHPGCLSLHWTLSLSLPFSRPLSAYRSHPSSLPAYSLFCYAQIQSFPIMCCSFHLFLSFSLCLFIPIQRLDSIGIFHGSGGNRKRPEVSLRLCTARRDRCMLVCSDA